MFVNTFFQKVKTLLETIPFDSQEFKTCFFQCQRTRAYLALGWIDINAPIESVADRSILHIAAKSDNIDLVDFIVILNPLTTVETGRGLKCQGH